MIFDYSTRFFPLVLFASSVAFSVVAALSGGHAIEGVVAKDNANAQKQAIKTAVYLGLAFVAFWAGKQA